MKQYRCKYFTLKELVCPEMLNLPEEILWGMFDKRVLKGADKIREKYGVVTINTGSLKECGLRSMDSKTGAKYSAHKFGRGLDLHIQRIENQWGGNKKAKIEAYNRVREQLMALSEFDDLNFEYGISWLHIDVVNRENRLFNP